jgi:CRISPR-associated protein Csb1
MSKANAESSLERFDAWLRDDGPVALICREHLEPIEGKDAVIFPATYAKPERMRDEDWPGYNIDKYPDGTNVCQIDSVGSQANRMEPLFKDDARQCLVPQVTIKAGEKDVNLLDAGHRAADAIVRFSSLAEDIENAFREYSEGNAAPLAKIAPTSLVFGAWDSRGTQVKLPRIIRSVIRAYDVKPVHRSAQYIPPVDYIGEGLVDPPDEKDKKQQDGLSEQGLAHAPAAWSHGGVLVERDIRRETIVNLATLRTLRTKGDPAQTMKLRRYILGLALVAFTAPRNPALREGCELVRAEGKPLDVRLVQQSGERDTLSLTYEEALDFARAAAQSFGVGESRTATFDPKRAKVELGKSDKERKASRRNKTKKTAD